MAVGILKNCSLCRITQHVKSVNYYLVIARKSSSSNKSKDKMKYDLIGQPNPVSNLRTIKFHVPDNENEIERQFRLKREEVQKWNQEFWTKHNTNFVKERKEFIALHEKETTVDGIKEPISADKLSVFYKRFLDNNWKTHLVYNYEWYKKNATLILLGLRVKVNRLKRLTYRNNND
ncbi:cytochrome c oxidase assembly factor 8 [Lycorma delicatula]|uniref:cytochrome c oxidase assembly factor 8 n=1 Tax=Lycorma delicatula TaxID=130591 RepID=UPI003F515DD6